MGYIIKNGESYGGDQANTAATTSFDNAGTNLSSMNVEDAIKEVNGDLTNLTKIPTKKTVLPKTTIQANESGFVFTFKRIGYLVMVEGRVKSNVGAIPTGSYTTIVDIPEGFRPKESGSGFLCGIASNGTSLECTYYGGSASAIQVRPIGSQIPVNVNLYFTQLVYYTADNFPTT